MLSTSQCFRSKKPPSFLTASWTAGKLKRQVWISQSHELFTASLSCRGSHYEVQKGLLEQHSLTQSCQLRNPRAGGISARTFLPQGQRCSHSKGGQVLTLGLCLKVGGCLLTDLIIDCLSCLNSHPVQIVTAALEMMDGAASL